MVPARNKPTRPGGGALSAVRYWLALLALALVVPACKGSVLSSKTEDNARQMIPVPICVKRLPRGTQPGVLVSLTPSEYWGLLLPTFDRNANTIDPTAPDCSGRLTLATISQQGLSRMRVDPEQAIIAPGADNLKIVWLESHPLGQDTYEGLLALTRVRESYFEVYAVGIHRGRPDGMRFTLQRMGPRLVIESTQQDCSGKGEERRCRASNNVYLMGTGALRAAAAFPMEAVATAPARDGLGTAEWRFSASTDYQDTAIRITEHLSIKSPAEGETRSSDLERAYRLENGQLVASGESLWTKTQREIEQRLAKNNRAAAEEAARRERRQQQRQAAPREDYGREEERRARERDEQVGEDEYGRVRTKKRRQPADDQEEERSDDSQ